MRYRRDIRRRRPFRSCRRPASRTFVPAIRPGKPSLFSEMSARTRRKQRVLTWVRAARMPYRHGISPHRPFRSCQPPAWQLCWRATPAGRPWRFSAGPSPRWTTTPLRRRAPATTELQSTFSCRASFSADDEAARRRRRRVSALHSRLQVFWNLRPLSMALIIWSPLRSHEPSSRRAKPICTDVSSFGDVSYLPTASDKHFLVMMALAAPASFLSAAEVSHAACASRWHLPKKLVLAAPASFLSAASLVHVADATLPARVVMRIANNIRFIPPPPVGSAAAETRWHAMSVGTFHIGSLLFFTLREHDSFGIAVPRLFQSIF